MAIRFEPKTDDAPKSKAVPPAPVTADAPINDAPRPTKSARANKSKPKDGPFDAAAPKED